MGWGDRGVLWIARTAAAWPGATWRVPHMPTVGLGAGRASAWSGCRYGAAGFDWPALPPFLSGLASPALVRPPDLLVSADARLIGGAQCRRGVRAAGSGASKFTLDAWLHYWAVEDFRAIAGTRRGAKPGPAPPRRLPAAAGCPGARACCWRASAAASGRRASVSVDRVGGAGAWPVPAAHGRRWWTASPCGAMARRRSGWMGSAPGRDRSRLSRRPAVGVAGADAARADRPAACAGTARRSARRPAID